MRTFLGMLFSVVMMSPAFASDNIPTLGSGISLPSKSIFKSIEVNIFCCAHHSNKKNSKLNDATPGVGLDLNFQDNEYLPGNFFLTGGNVENSHRGRTKFLGVGWKKKDIFELSAISVGGGLGVIGLQYEAPDINRTMSRILPVGFGSVSYKNFSLKLAPAPGKATILFGSYEIKF